MLDPTLFLFFMCLRQIAHGTKEIPIFSLCRNQQEDVELLVDDALTLVPQVDGYPENETDNLDVLKYGFDTGRCKGTFRLAPRAGTAFLIVLTNNLPVNRFRCTAWNVILKIRSPKQFVGFGCTKYSVHFFESPLTVNFLPSAVKQLIRMANEHYHETRQDATSTQHDVTSGQQVAAQGSKPLSLTITPVLFGCQSHLNEWRPCDIAAGVCINSKLVCDGYNNCGLWEDEISCPDYNGTCPKIPFKSTSAEDYIYYDESAPSRHTFDSVLSFILAFCSFLLLSIFVTIIVYCAYLKKKMKSEKEHNMASYIRQFRHSLYSKRKYDHKIHHRPSDDVYTGDLLSASVPRSSHPKTSLPLLNDNGSVRNYCSNSISEGSSSFAMPTKCKRFF